jgi:cysteine-rich repeat protein
VVDGGEQCDDGNSENCDGCDEFCDLESGIVCGDGTVAPAGCHEQCDDGNQTTGDGCSGSCQLEHIPGGGKVTTDCCATWRIDNPSNVPRYDKRGFVSAHQECTDNDPVCDFDGGVVGSCTFHVAVCANNSEPVECAPSRIRSWTIASPSAKQALARPPLAAVRSVLEAAVLPSIVGSSDPDRCSPDAGVVVALRGVPGAFKAGKLKLKTRAEVYGGAVDTDTLQLRCDPS